MTAIVAILKICFIYLFYFFGIESHTTTKSLLLYVVIRYDGKGGHLEFLFCYFTSLELIHTITNLCFYTWPFFQNLEQSKILYAVMVFVKILLKCIDTAPSSLLRKTIVHVRRPTDSSGLLYFVCLLFLCHPQIILIIFFWKCNLKLKRLSVVED